MDGDTKGYRRLQRCQRIRIQAYPTRSNQFWVPVPTPERRKPRQLPSQSEPLLPQALVDPVVSRGKMGEQEREGPGGCQPVRSSYGIQALCPEDAKHINLVSVERTEVLGGVVHHGVEVLGGE